MHATCTCSSRKYCQHQLNFSQFHPGNQGDSTLRNDKQCLDNCGHNVTTILLDDLLEVIDFETAIMKIDIQVGIASTDPQKSWFQPGDNSCVHAKTNSTIWNFGTGRIRSGHRLRKCHNGQLKIHQRHCLKAVKSGFNPKVIWGKGTAVGLEDLQSQG